MVSIAKYETNSVPDERILERLAKLADQNKMSADARMFRDHGRLRNDQIPPAPPQTAAGALPAPNATQLGASTLGAVGWLLLNSDYERVKVREFAFERVKEAVIRRGLDLTPSELLELGEIGNEARTAVDEWRKLQRRVQELTLPVAIRQLRKTARSRALFTESMGVSDSKLVEIEAGHVDPDVSALIGIIATRAGHSFWADCPELWFILNAAMKRAFRDTQRAVESGASVRDVEVCKGQLLGTLYAFRLLLKGFPITRIVVDKVATTLLHPKITPSSLSSIRKLADELNESGVLPLPFPISDLSEAASEKRPRRN